MKSKINDLIQNALILQNEEENENNWLRMNNILLGLTNEKEIDILSVYNQLHEFIIRCILSDRSRLSGTALEFMKLCINKIGMEMAYEDQVIDSCFKLCRKANKIYNKRGEELLILAASKINFHKNVKILKNNLQSNNKKVRKAVFLGIESSIKESNEKSKYLNFYRNFIQIGQKDADIESRNICKRILKMASSIDGVPTSFSIGKNEIEQKKEMKSNFPFLQRAPVRSNISEKVQESEVRPIFKNYLKRSVTDLKKIFEQEPISSRHIATPPKKQVKVTGIEKKKKSIEKKELVTSIHNYTPRSLNKYIEKYREDVRRLKVSPVENKKEKFYEKKKNKNNNLWTENDQLFSKEFPPSEKMPIIDKFELSFEDLKVDNNSHNVHQENDSNLKGIEVEQKIVSEEKQGNTEILSINNPLSKSAIKTDNPNKNVSTKIDQEKAKNESIELNTQINKNERSNIQILTGQKKVDKNSSISYIGQSVKMDQESIMDAAAKFEKDQNEMTIAENYNNDPTFVIQKNEKTNKKSSVSPTLQIFSSQNVTFEGLVSSDYNSPQQSDTQNEEKPEIIIDRSLRLSFNQLLKNLEKESIVDIDVDSQTKSTGSDSSNQRERSLQNNSKNIFDNHKQNSIFENNVNEDKKIFKSENLSSPLQEKIIENNKSVNQSNINNESDHQNAFGNEEFSVTINLQNEFEKISEKSCIPVLKSSELSKIIETSSIDRISHNDHDSKSSTDDTKYSFLEESFNSFSVGDDIKPVNTCYEDETASNSSFEDSKLKNRFEENINDEMGKSKSQIGDFSELGTVIEFNKNIFKRK